MIEIVDAADRLARWLISDSIQGLNHHEALLVLNMAEFFVMADSPSESFTNVRQEAKQMLIDLLDPAVFS